MTDENRAIYRGGDKTLNRSELEKAIEPMASDLQPNAPEMFTPKADVIEALKSGGHKVVARAGVPIPMAMAVDLGLVPGAYDTKR